MDVRDYIGLARKWLWLFILASLVAGVGAFVATLGMPRQYLSQTTLMVGRAVKSAEPNAAEIFMTQQLAQVYANMAVREPVLKGAFDALGLQGDWSRLRGMVQASAVPGTQFVEIRVIDMDSVRAQWIAGRVAEKLISAGPTTGEQQRGENEAFVLTQIALLRTKIEQATIDLQDIETQIGLATSARAIADLETRKRALVQQMETWDGRLANYFAFDQGSQTNSLSVIEPATPGVQVGPNVRMNVLFAVALGFGLALMAVLAIEYLDDTVKTEETLHKRLGLPGLATVERVADMAQRQDGVVALHAPRSPAAEAYRVLRTNLNFSLLKRPSPVIVITSANPGEGKSTTVANLAVAAAQAGKRVILLDSDLRRPSIHRFFELSNSVGMTTLLLDPALSPKDVLHDIEGVPGLSVLTSGPLPPNPAEVLESDAAKELVAGLRGLADLMVVDSPPLLVVADAAILATQADATVLVCEFGLTRNDVVRKALQVLERVGVKPVGAVINKLDPGHAGYYYHYDYRYRYRYSDYYGEHGAGEAPEGSAGDKAERRGRRHRSSRPWWRRLLDDVM